MSFSVSKCKLLGINGPNSSGKTILLTFLADDFVPSYGVIKYDDKDLKRVPLLERGKI